MWRTERRRKDKGEGGGWLKGRERKREIKSECAGWSARGQQRQGITEKEGEIGGSG